jgi:hypothetical protein
LSFIVVSIGFAFADLVHSQDTQVRVERIGESEIAKQDIFECRLKFGTLEEWVSHLTFRFNLKNLIRAEETKNSYIAVFFDGTDQYTVCDYIKEPTKNVKEFLERSRYLCRFTDNKNGKDIPANQIEVVEQISEETEVIKIAQNISDSTITKNRVSYVSIHGWVFKIAARESGVGIFAPELGIERSDGWVIRNAKNEVILEPQESSMNRSVLLVLVLFFATTLSMLILRKRFSK